MSLFRNGKSQPASPSFKDLLELHRELDELFFEHQRALMRLDLDRAESSLRDYAAQLLAHIRDEETFMIPIYQERAAAPIGAAAEIFLNEHEKLRQHLILFEEEIQKIRKMEDVERGVLFLIDSEHLFKRLLVHHDARENKMLYPLLDEVTTPAERGELFSQFESSPLYRQPNVRMNECAANATAATDSSEGPFDD